jgi:hypothetical protein
VPDRQAELAARDGLILDILRLAERLGIAFESPTMILERDRPSSTTQGQGDPEPRSPADARSAG